MRELSLNEVETLAAKAARGAGFPWGLADDIGRAARRLAQRDPEWSNALLALLARWREFEPPSPRRIALWRSGETDERGAAPLCPVRTAALLNDAPPACALKILNVGLPVWLDALLAAQGTWRGGADLHAASADVVLTRGGDSATARRAAIADEELEALGAYAARTYVPESERSRARGAGGGRVDDE